MRSILRIEETAIRAVVRHLPKKIQNETRLFSVQTYTFYSTNPIFYVFSRISGIAEAAISSLFQISAPILQRKPGRVHIFCIFVRRVPEKRTNRKSDDEKITDPAPPARRLLVAGRSPGAAIPHRPAANRNHYGRLDLRTDRTAAQHAQHRGGQGHHLPAQKQLVQTDDAFPDAEPAVAVVRRRFHPHQDRRPRETAPPAVRRLHLFAQAGLLGPAGIHRLRHRGAAQREHEHRARNGTSGSDRPRSRPTARGSTRRAPCNSSIAASSTANSTSTATSGSSASTTSTARAASTSRPKAP